MIDRKLLNLDRLVDILLDSLFGNVNYWTRLAEIVPEYMPPFPRADTRPICVVRCLVRPEEPEEVPGVSTGRYSYLRTGGIVGWKSGGYFWDCYGDNFLNPEYALMALIHAPVPPALVKRFVWTHERGK